MIPISKKRLPDAPLMPDLMPERSVRHRPAKSDLPQDLFLLTLSYLDFKDLAAIRATSRRFSLPSEEDLEHVVSSQVQALHHAVELNELEMLRRLISHNASVYTRVLGKVQCLYLHSEDGLHLTDSQLGEVAARASRATSLILACAYKLTNQGLANAAALPLMLLSLNDCPEITDPALAPFVNDPLRELSIVDCPKVTDGVLPFLKDSSIDKLVLGYDTYMGPQLITDVGLTHLRQMPRLASLKLIGLDCVTNVGLRPLTHLPLTALTLSNCNKIDDASLAPLASLRMLRQFKLSDCNSIDGIGFQFFTHLPISELSLTRCHNIRDERFSYLKNLPLRKMKLTRCCRITGMGIRDLANGSLEELRILHCKRIIEVNLAQFKRFRQLFLKNCPRLAPASLALPPQALLIVEV